MNLVLQRELSTAHSTPGQLYVNGIWECYTLEDIVRERRYDDGSLIEVAAWKIQNETAIPSGRYPVTIDFSLRFHRLMPHVLNVPGFSGVRLHYGNTAADTEGCLLVGQVRNSLDEILQSRLAFEALFPKLVAAAGKEESIWLTIEPAVVLPSIVAT